MKFAITLLILIHSVLAVAKDQSIQEALEQKKCHFEVTKEIIIESSKQYVIAGNASLTMRAIDSSNNRRLKVGRILNISAIDEGQIFLNDKNIESLCIFPSHYCDEPTRVSVSSYNQSAQNKLKLVCNTKPTIDI